MQSQSAELVAEAFLNSLYIRLVIQVLRGCGCLKAAPERSHANFYRTAVGAEVDLLLEMPNQGLWAIEIKRSLAPKLERGFHHAREDLKPDRCFVVYSGDERYPRAEGVEVIGLEELCRTVCP